MILSIYGAGGLGLEVQGFAFDLNRHSHRWDEIVYLDDAVRESANNDIQIYNIYNLQQKYKMDEVEIIIAQGEPLLREKLYKRIKSEGYRLATLIHPKAAISSKAAIGEGVIINNYNVTISPNVVIGTNTYIQPFVAIGHDSTIGENCIISAFSSIAGNCNIGDNVYISMHTAIKEGIKIGNNCIIGMGSMVYRNVPDNHTVFNSSTKMARHEIGTYVFNKKT